MPPLLLEVLAVAAFHAVLGLAVPGLAACVLLGPKSHGKLSPPRLFLFVAALGFLYGAAQLLIILLAARALSLDLRLLPWAKYGLDAAVGLWLLRSRGPDLRSLLARALSLSRGERLLLATCAAFGAASILSHPAAMDNGQLWWTQTLVDEPRMETLDLGRGVFRTGAQGRSNGTGALAYSALIAYPGWLLAPLPVPVAAAAFKPLLLLLFGLAVLSLARAPPLREPGPARWTILAFGLLSAFGLLGLCEQGKDTVYGMVFAMAYWASLLDEEAGGPEESGLYFAAAVACGVLALPYLAFLTALYAAFARRGAELLARVRAMAAWGSLSLAVASSVILRVPLAWAAFGAGLAWLAARGIEKRFAALPARPERPLPAWAVPTALLALAGLCAVLLPARAPVLSEYDVLGNPVYEYWAPFDGRQTYARFLFGFWDYLSPSLVLAGLAGILLFVLDPALRGNAALGALAVFPFASAAYVLLLVRLQPRSEFTLHVWDLIKGLPLYCQPVIFGLFAALLAERAARRLPAPARRPALALACAAALAVGAWHKRDALRELARPARFTASGGHHDPDVAELVELLSRPGGPGRLFIFDDAKAGLPDLRFHIAMLSRLDTVVLYMDRPEDLAHAFGKAPAYLVASGRLAERLPFETVRCFGSGDCLLLMPPL